MKENKYWIIGVDADTEELRPARVSRTDAKRLGVVVYNSYAECSINIPKQ